MNRTFGLLAGAFFGWMIAYFWNVAEIEADWSLRGLERVIAILMILLDPNVVAFTGFCGLVGMMIGWVVDVSKQ